MEMDEILKQKDNFQEQINQFFYQKRETAISTSAVRSQYFQKYSQFFRGIDPVDNIQLIKYLRQIHIVYVSERDHKHFKITATHFNYNKQASALVVQLGTFDILLSLYHDFGKNHTHFLNGKASTFATIYEYTAQKPSSILKCTSFKPKDFLDCLVNIVKEYAYLKIAGFLAVGPKPIQIMGFDLVCYADCIQFSMEKCYPITKIDQDIQKKLKQKLAILHKFHIVHADIKPQNCYFSPSLNQPVFIDFGLAEMISQKIGDVTQTFFMGSLTYCCQQMNELYYESTNGLVDLYYNDVVCMIRSFSAIKKQGKTNQTVSFLKQNVSNDDDQSSEQQIEAYHSVAWEQKVLNNYTLLRVFNIIYNNSFTESNYYEYQNCIKSNKNVILKFINNLQFGYTKEVELLVQKILSNKNQKQSVIKIKEKLISNSQNIDIQFFIHQKQNNDDFNSEKSVLLQSNHSYGGIFITNKKNQVYNIDEQAQIISERMYELAKGLKINSVYTSKKQLSIEINAQTALESVTSIYKLQKHKYFNIFVNFTDLRKGFASKVQQFSIVSLMLNYIGKQNLNEQSWILKLGYCWDYILKYFLANESLVTSQVLSVLFHNLTIIQYYSQQQLIQIIHLFCKLSIDKLSTRFQITYACISAINWTLNRSVSRYNLIQFKGKYYAAIYEQIIVFDQLGDKWLYFTLYSIALGLLTNFMDFQRLNKLFNIMFSNYAISQETHLDIKATLATFIMGMLSLRINQDIRQIFVNQYTNIHHANFSLKYIFNHYHFSYNILSKILKQKNITKQIEENFHKCFDRFQLEHLFIITQPSTLINDNILKDLKYKLKQMNPEFIGNSQFLLYQIENLVYRQIQEINQIVKKNIHFQFIMSIKINKLQNSHDLLNYFASSFKIFIIFCKVNRDLNPNFIQQVISIYQKFKKNYQQTKDQVQKKYIYESFKDFTTIYLKQTHQYDSAIKKYFEFITESMQKKLFYKIPQYYKSAYYLLHKLPSQSQRQKHQKTFYKFWMNHIQILSLSDISFCHIFKLVYRFSNILWQQDLDQLIKFHYTLIRNIQDKKIVTIEQYIRQTYIFITHKAKTSHFIIQKLKKSLNKYVLIQLQKYYGSSVLLLILGFEKKYDLRSQDLLKICIQNLSFIKGNCKQIILNVLYRYLILKKTGIRPQTRILFQFQSNRNFIQFLRKQNNRQQKFWRRRLIKYCQTPQQKYLPINLLIKDYDSFNSYHEIFKSLIKKIYKNSGKN